MAGSGFPGGGSYIRAMIPKPSRRGPWAVKITREAAPRAHYLPDMWLPGDADIALHKLDPLQFALRVRVEYRATFRTKGDAVAAILDLEMPELEFEIVNLKKVHKTCRP